MQIPQCYTVVLGHLNPAPAGPGVNDSAPGWFGSTKTPENTIRF